VNIMYTCVCFISSAIWYFQTDCSLKKRHPLVVSIPPRIAFPHEPLISGVMQSWLEHAKAVVLIKYACPPDDARDLSLVGV